MPRDWDLFALAGPPLVMCAIYVLVGSPEGTRCTRACSLIVVAGLLTLLPRAVIFATPGLAIPAIENYSNLDIAKSGSTRFLLSNYLESVGDSTAAKALDSVWVSVDPNSFAMNAAVDSASRIDSASLERVFRECIRRNPLNWAAWGNLAVIQLGRRHFDSALYDLQVADGLNPYNASTTLNLSYCYYSVKDFAGAEKFLNEAIHLDSSILTTSVLMFQADLYRDSHQEDKYVTVFVQIAQRSDAPSKYVRGWIEFLLKKGEYQKAAERIRQALGVQIDTHYIGDLLQAYPELKSYLSN